MGRLIHYCECGEELFDDIPCHKCMNIIFDTNLDKLPTIDAWSKKINFDSSNILDSYKIRNEYTKHCFPILSDDFLRAMKNFCRPFKKIVEVGCGEGWFTYWLEKYEIKVSAAIDDKHWPNFKKYLPFVIQENAVNYIEDYSDIDLIIMSWPNYDNSFAFDIWKNMSERQTLLYIGEGDEGCTGDDEFHKAIQNHEVEDEWNLMTNFRSFFGIHDEPYILRK